MHYSKTTFSKNGYDITIRPLPGMYDKGIGQRLKLSPLDIKQANLLYKCACKYFSSKTSPFTGDVTTSVTTAVDITIYYVTFRMIYDSTQQANP